MNACAPEWGSMANPIPSNGPSGLTGDILIDALTTGFRWTLGTDRTIDWSISGGFAGEFWTAPNLVIQYATEMLDTFSYFANVRFNYVGNFSNPNAASFAGSEINFYTSASTQIFPSASTWAQAFFPTTQNDAAYVGAAGDVILNINSPANTLTSYDPGSAGWFLFLHEIGHALGLKHPFDSGGTGRPTLSSLGLGELDIDWATIMAYSDDYNYNSRAYDPASPMLLDVLALQHLYGPNMSTNAGSGVYNLTTINRYVSIWDAGGQDAVSTASSDRGWYIYMPDDQISALSPSRVGYAMPLNETELSSPRSLYWLIGDIEDAVGSAFADEIYGSALRNNLQGGGGADYIDGWTGNDTLDGGAGNDDVYGDAGNDIIMDTGGGNNYLRGEDGDDSISGGSGFDDMHGNMGNDTVVSAAGDDWVVGGRDNDSLVGGTGQNLVYGNLGNDTCEGGDNADIVRGGQDNDSVSGGAGNDFISGDRGDDTMSGGLGADRFNTFGLTGIDRVLDFSRAQGDQVQFDPGTTYTLAQVGADAVINMTGGGQMILVGVSVGSLTGSWIFGT